MEALTSNPPALVVAAVDRGEELVGRLRVGGPEPPLLLLPGDERGGEGVVCELHDAVAEGDAGLDAEVRRVLLADDGVAGECAGEDGVHDGLCGVVADWDVRTRSPMRPAVQGRRTYL